jgi:hypothetical protein
MDFTRHYELIRGSDVARDGMFLELWERASDDLLIEAFYSDADGSMALEQYRCEVPPPVWQWFQQMAWTYLPPVTPTVSDVGGDT